MTNMCLYGKNTSLMSLFHVFGSWSTKTNMDILGGSVAGFSNHFLFCRGTEGLVVKMASSGKLPGSLHLSLPGSVSLRELFRS